MAGQNSPEGQRGSAYGGNLSTLFDLPTAFHVFAGVLLAGTAGIYLATRERAA